MFVKKKKKKEGKRVNTTRRSSWSCKHVLSYPTLIIVNSRTTSSIHHQSHFKGLKVEFSNRRRSRNFYQVPCADWLVLQPINSTQSWEKPDADQPFSLLLRPSHFRYKSRQYWLSRQKLLPRWFFSTHEVTFYHIYISKKHRNMITKMRIIFRNNVNWSIVFLNRDQLLSKMIAYHFFNIFRQFLHLV